MTRKSTLSKEEFHHIWVSEHALLGHAAQVRRYVPSFILEGPTRPDVPTQAMNVDAMAELCYDDMAALKAAASPQMKAVTDNGALHLGAIKSFITEEVAIIPRNEALFAEIRRLCLSRRSNFHRSLTEFICYPECVIKGEGIE